MPQNINRQISSIRKKPIGLLVVISAPSGAGKTTIAKEVLKKVPHVVRIVTATSRPKRPGEINKKDYIFLSRDEFQKRIKENYFVEWAEVHGHFYGTPKVQIDQKVKEGNIVLLVIDVQGAEQLKKIYPDAVYIFILPPSLKELRARLKKRNTETSKSLTVRIRNAMIEYKFIHDYDYAVINDLVSHAVKKLTSILLAEQCKVNRWIKRKK